jgi:hypothetical protein
MVQIYKEQATTTPTQETQKLADISGLEKQATSMQQTYDKQLKTYAKEQSNIGSQAISDAYIQFPADEKEFDKTVKQSLQKIEEVMGDANAKVMFRADMKISASTYSNKIKNNFVKKTESEYKNTTTTEADFIFDMVKENLPLLYTDANAVGEIRINLGKLNEMAQEIDSKGFVLNATDRAKINDLDKFHRYYASLGFADSLKAEDNTEEMSKQYKSLKENKAKVMKEMDLTADKYTELLNAYSPNANGNSVGASLYQTELEASIIGLDISKVKGEGLVANDMNKLFGVINSLNEGLTNEDVSKSYYDKNIPKLKATYYNMAKTQDLYNEADGKKWFRPIKISTVGSNLMDDVERLSAGWFNGTDDDSKRYDATMLLDKYARGKGIDIKSTDEVAIADYKDLVYQYTPSLMRQLYPKIATKFSDDDLRDPAFQDSVMAYNKGNETRLKVVNELQNQELKDIVDGFN